MAHGLASILLQAADHASTLQQLKVMCKRGGVASITELPHHFLVAQGLATVAAGHVKYASQQRRFLYGCHQQHVFTDGGFNQCITYIFSPTYFVANQAGRTWVATIKDMLLQRKTKSFAHFVKLPVSHSRHFKAPCKALRQAACNQQRR